MTDHKAEWYLKRNKELTKTLEMIRDIIEDSEISYPATVWQINEILKKVDFEPSRSGGV